MKLRSISSIFTFFCLISISLFFSSCDADQAHEHTAQPYNISDNADQNIKLVSDYMAALLTSDGDSLRSLVNEGFMLNGPAATDSATIDQVVETWTGINSSRTSQDFGVFASSSLTVNEGDNIGEWAMLWGNYTATDNVSGTDLNVPWHGVYKIDSSRISMSAVFFDNLAPSLATGVVVAVDAGEE